MSQGSKAGATEPLLFLLLRFSAVTIDIHLLTLSVHTAIKCIFLKVRQIQIVGPLHCLTRYTALQYVVCSLFRIKPQRHNRIETYQRWYFNTYTALQT